MNRLAVLPTVTLSIFTKSPDGFVFTFASMMPLGCAIMMFSPRSSDN